MNFSTNYTNKVARVKKTFISAYKDAKELNDELTKNNSELQSKIAALNAEIKANTLLIAQNDKFIHNLEELVK